MSRTGLRALLPGPRTDAPTSAILVFPLFLLYQIGILLGARGHNGADLITNRLIELCSRDLTTYAQLMVGMIGAYGVALVWLRRRGQFHPRAFIPILAEATVYALAMGLLIQLVIVQLLDVFPLLTLPLLALGPVGPIDAVVISAGAGFHEELVFRVGLLGGIAFLLQDRFGERASICVALIVSAAAFSMAHHVGPGAEPLASIPVLYRFLAGLYFGALYHWRGFAVAVWTHALYDVFVLLAH